MVGRGKATPVGIVLKMPAHKGEGDIYPSAWWLRKKTPLIRTTDKCMLWYYFLHSLALQTMYLPGPPRKSSLVFAAEAGWHACTDPVRSVLAYNTPILLHGRTLDCKAGEYQRRSAIFVLSPRGLSLHASPRKIYVAAS